MVRLVARLSSVVLLVVLGLSVAPAGMPLGPDVGRAAVAAGRLGRSSTVAHARAGQLGRPAGWSHGRSAWATLPAGLRAALAHLRGGPAGEARRPAQRAQGAQAASSSTSTWSQQAKLTVGWPVALSRDGSTALVGAYGTNNSTGAAYVFVRSGTTWVQQAELSAADGTYGDQFGWSVALSGDGNSALIGAYGKYSSTGAAYAFVRSGSTWSQQQELTAAYGASNDQFGWAVALSGDGSTALIGAPRQRAFSSSGGAAYVFTRSGSSWSQQQELTASNGLHGDGFGASVALSADGTTALIGACRCIMGYGAGVAYVFVRSGSNWTQQELWASDGVQGDDFGWSVALSGDGTIALIGAYGTGVAYVFTGSGSSWSQQAELTASDGASGDTFGFSVALSSDGNTALIGASNANGFPAAPGAAYVFTGSGSSWSQQAKLVASDSVNSDVFGASVALSGDGNTALVGAANRGAAYVFVTTPAPTATPTATDTPTNTPTNMPTNTPTSTATPAPSLWGQQAELTASNRAPTDYFGWSVALSADGNTALIGAYYKNSHTGAAYVFVRSGAAWSQQQGLAAGDGASGDRFGSSVALSGDGNIALIGAPGKNSATGAAYVFARSGSSWGQQTELPAVDGAVGDEFGNAVALSDDGNTALIGAPGKNSYTGTAYVYVRGGTAWSQQAELTAGDGAGGDYFGWSAALSSDGNTALIGAEGRSSAAGTAYVFVRSGTAWSQQQELSAADGAGGDRFSSSVTLSADGNTALIGAYWKNSATGAAYVYGRSGSSWSQQAELTASDGANQDQFGNAVALSDDGNTALIGAWGKNVGTGAAYVYARNGSTWSQQAKPTAADSADFDEFGSSVALSDGGNTALIGAGSKNIGTGAAYVFTTVPAPTATPPATNTPLPTNTATPTNSPAPPTATPTNSPIPATSTPTQAATASATPTSTPTPTKTPSNTPTTTPIPPTVTNTPTNTPSSTPTHMPSSTPSNTPTHTPTSTPVPPTATSTATITPTSTPVPAASIILSPARGGFQTIVTVTGTNFGPQESIDLFCDSTSSTPLSTTTSTSLGSFVDRFGVPQAIAGTHTVIAVGQRSGLSARASFRVIPTTTLRHTAATPGVTDVLSGYGFGPGETTQTHWAGTSGPLLGARMTSPLGSFSGPTALTFTVPLSATGAYKIVTVGLSSGEIATTTLTLPGLSMTPSHGARGSRATLAGTGYQAYETVTLTWNCATSRCRGTTVLGTPAANAQGSFSNLSVTIPSTATVGTTYPIGGTGRTSGAFARTSFTVTS